MPLLFLIVKLDTNKEGSNEVSGVWFVCLFVFNLHPRDECGTIEITQERLNYLTHVFIYSIIYYFFYLFKMFLTECLQNSVHTVWWFLPSKETGVQQIQRGIHCGKHTELSKESCAPTLTLQTGIAFNLFTHHFLPGPYWVQGTVLKWEDEHKQFLP